MYRNQPKRYYSNIQNEATFCSGDPSGCLFFVNLSEQKCTPEIEKEFLAKHNELRAKHGAAALVIDADISAFAQEWANYLSSHGKFQHRQPNKYGENLYMSWGSAGAPHDNGGVPVVDWYNEVSKYHYFGHEPSMSHFSDWGHFTQLIWKGSKKVGVGCALQGNSFYVVGNYDPHGNVVGHFLDNVPGPVQN